MPVARVSVQQPLAQRTGWVSVAAQMTKDPEARECHS